MILSQFSVAFWEIHWEIYLVGMNGGWIFCSTRFLVAPAKNLSSWLKDLFQTDFCVVSTIELFDQSKNLFVHIQPRISFDSIISPYNNAENAHRV